MSYARHARSTLAGVVVVLGGLTLGCNDQGVEPIADSRDLTVAAAKGLYSAWAPAVNLEQLPGMPSSLNTTALEGCPYISRDGKMLFFASNRTGAAGIDIYVATRDDVNDPWSAPVNANALFEGDADVNTSANELCPTLARDNHTFFFVSNRTGGCGGDDIWVTRIRDDHGFDEPENLGCQVNSAGNEAGPFLVAEPGSGKVLYFSSTRAGGYSAEAAGAVTGDADIYESEWRGGAFGPARLVAGVNSSFDDLQPTLRHDALEIFFASNRTGSLGLNDIWSATREKARDSWGTPYNLGPNVNSAANEIRPTLSWDATALYFGSTRPGSEGSQDIYLTTRAPLRGSGK